MTRLKAFNEKSKCGKCGHNKIGAHYMKSVEAAGAVTRSERERNSLPLGEFIRRACERCGYEWPEACIAPAKKGKKK